MPKAGNLIRVDCSGEQFRLFGRQNREIRFRAHQQSTIITIALAVSRPKKLQVVKTPSSDYACHMIAVFAPSLTKSTNTIKQMAII